jgi:hypothetical protein
MTLPGMLALSEALGRVLRDVRWIVLGGLLAAGLCYCARYLLSLAYDRTHRPECRVRGRAQDHLIEEAHRGIAEIEAFLAAQCATSDRVPPLPPKALRAHNARNPRRRDRLRGVDG